MLINYDTSSFIKYNLRYTQEFGDCYLDDWVIFLKELEILRNSETGHLACSVSTIQKCLY